jgi:cytochrome P450
MFDYSAQLATVPIGLLLAWLATAFTQYARRQYRRRSAIRAHGCKPARFLPQWDPIFGIDTAVQMFRAYGLGTRNATFLEQHVLYGPTFQSLALGKTRTFTIDPINLQSILNSNSQSWGVQSLQMPSWKPLVGVGLMDTDGPHWRFSRDMVQPLFKKDQISDLSSFSQHVDGLIVLIPRDGAAVDLQPLFARLILDFSMDFLFGCASATLTTTPDPDALGFLNAFHYAQATVGKKTQLPYLTAFTTDRKFKNSCAVARAFVDQYIQRAKIRLQQGKNLIIEETRRYILADQLLKKGMDGEELGSQLLNVFLPAHETTAVLLTNVLFHLARNPHVYQRLRAEILEGKDVPTHFNQLKRFKYLQNIVNETSRLSPVVAQSARSALNDTTIPTGGGESGDSPIYVLKDDTVQFDFHTLHRRPEIYGEDVDSFRPDRWNDLSLGTWDYLPFGGGPRVCPANQMAFMQACYTVARIAQGFSRIENRDLVVEYIEEYRITTCSKNGCKVALIV